MDRLDIVPINQVNEDGFVSGGKVTGPGLDIQWQNGPWDESTEPNGTFVETVLYAALQRLQAYQANKLSCRQNAIAITKIEEAIMWLGNRRSERFARAVQGTYEP